METKHLDEVETKPHILGESKGLQYARGRSDSGLDRAVWRTCIWILKWQKETNLASIQIGKGPVVYRLPKDKGRSACLS